MSQPINESAGPPGTGTNSETSHQPAETDGTALTPLETLGERLRAARYAAQMTQEELAGESFSKSYISAVERSKMTPSISALRLLAERLGISLAYLLGEQEHDPRAAEYATKLGRQPGKIEFAKQLDEAEALLRSHKAGAALEHLGSQEAATAFGSPYQVRWYCLYAWALLRQQRAQEVEAALERGLQAARASQDHRSEGHLLLIGAAAAAVRGEAETAERRFQDTIAFCQQITNSELLGSVRGEYGAFLAAHGRYQEAYEQLRLAYDASEQLGTHH